MKSFEAIAQVKPRRLFVIADGPRLVEETEKCEDARSVISKVNWDCEVTTDFSEKNLGCKQRISSGVAWVFSQVEEAVFLEDDCLPAPSFFFFCQTLLDRYRDDERVMHISGGSFLFDQIKLAHSYYFSRYSFGGYGWATWKRAWKHYDPDMRSWPEFKEAKIIEMLFEGPHEREYWEHILDKTFRGDIDTWDFQWFYTCWTQNGLSILPSVNLVSNLGFRADATHTNTPYEKMVLANAPTGNIWKISHPEFIVRHRDADDHTSDVYFGLRNFKESNLLRKKMRYYLAAIGRRLKPPAMMRW